MPSHRLVLLRHGKAAEPDAADDHERDLTARGRRDAEAVGRWLLTRDLRPDLAVVSDAVRARATWEHVVAGLGPTLVALPVAYEPRVYEAGVDDLVGVVAGATEDAATVLLVGHNPGVEELAAALDDGSGDAGVRAELGRGLPTCGLAVLAGDLAWAEVTPGSLRLVEVSAPRG